MGIKDDIEAKGFCIARQVFTADEVAQLREAVAAGVARSDKAHPDNFTWRPTQHIAVGDLIAQPELEPMDFVVFHEKLLAVVRELVGEHIVYFGDSSMELGVGPRGFHKDNAHRSDASGSDWSSPYTLIRFGLYLQDHARHSGGLKVRVGSHRVASDSTGPAVNASSEPGDLVLWKLTLTHSGNAVRPVGLPGLCLPPAIENRLPSFLRMPEQKTRRSMFGTFAAPSDHLNTYLAYIGGRPEFEKRYENSSFTAKARALAGQRGVELRVPMAAFGRHASTQAA